MKFTVAQHENDWRLDQFLVEHSGLSRSQLSKFIKQDRVKIDGKIAKKAGQTLSEGQCVYFSKPKDESPYVLAEEGALEIIYEDEDLMVINKPAGLVTHPAPGNRSGTLANLIKGHLSKELTQVQGFVRPGIVHRLDKYTSGLMVVAKNAASQKNLANQFKERTVHKIYVSLVAGQLNPREGKIDAPIMRDEVNRQKMMVSALAEARSAVTHYKVLAYYPGYTLLELRLEQGRTHQIRVHLNSIGFPVVGDQVYGREQINKAIGLKRQFLHAAKISFQHPADGRTMTFESPLPPELEAVLESFKA